MCASFSAFFDFFMCTFLHLHVHVTVNIQPGQCICGTHQKKPLWRFSLISSVLHQQREMKPTNQKIECWWRVERRSRSERVPVSQSFTHTGSRRANGYAHPLSVFKISRKGDFKHTCNFAAVSWKCMHACIQKQIHKTKFWLCLWFCSLARLAVTSCLSHGTSETEKVLEYVTYWGRPIKKWGRHMRQDQYMFEIIPQPVPGCELLCLVGNKCRYICSLNTFQGRTHEEIQCTEAAWQVSVIYCIYVGVCVFIYMLSL